MKHGPNLRQTALIVVLRLSLVGLGVALYELLSPQRGTTGTAGAILVTVSTALLAIAAALLAFMRVSGWLVGLLFSLLLLDAAAAAAGYFLMAYFLVAAMLGALLAGLVAAFGGSRQDRVSA